MNKKSITKFSVKTLTPFLVSIFLAVILFSFFKDDVDVATIIKELSRGSVSRGVETDSSETNTGTGSGEEDTAEGAIDGVEEKQGSDQSSVTEEDKEDGDGDEIDGQESDENETEVEKVETVLEKNKNTESDETVARQKKGENEKVEGNKSSAKTKALTVQEKRENDPEQKKTETVTEELSIDAKSSYDPSAIRIGEKRSVEDTKKKEKKKQTKSTVIKSDKGYDGGNERYGSNVKMDKHGNPEGSKYDLAKDGAFKGKTIAVLQFYTMENFDFRFPQAALAEKGFKIERWTRPPSAPVLREKLKKACQLWIIATSTQLLNKAHLKVIKEFFDKGKGVYIWGDNQPYYVDANYVARYLIGAEMFGNIHGDRVVTIDYERKNVGLNPGHPISMGLKNVYEGITIATIRPNKNLTPLLYGSAGNLVCATYEEKGGRRRKGKRLILDGGFTRLYLKWNHAGTSRYVKNAACWLANKDTLCRRFKKKRKSKRRK